MMSKDAMRAECHKRMQKYVLKGEVPHNPYNPGSKKTGKHKLEKVMGEFKRGTLHSGSKHGPKITKRSQAIAVALSEQREADKKRKRKK